MEVNYPQVAEVVYVGRKQVLKEVEVVSVRGIEFTSDELLAIAMLTAAEQDTDVAGIVLEEGGLGERLVDADLAMDVGEYGPYRKYKPTAVLRRTLETMVTVLRKAHEEDE